jgi:hypothetical protein
MGGLEDRNLLDFRLAGQPKAHLFVAAQDIPFKPGPIEVQGPAFAGEFGLAAAVPANKYAIVIWGVLVEKPGVQKALDYLRRNSPLAKIRKHPALVRVRGRQDEGRLLFGRRRLGAGDGLATVGGVSGPPMIGQKVLHRLREAHPAELLEE